MDDVLRALIKTPLKYFRTFANSAFYRSFVRRPYVLYELMLRNERSVIVCAFQKLPTRRTPTARLKHYEREQRPTFKFFKRSADFFLNAPLSKSNKLYEALSIIYLFIKLSCIQRLGRVMFIIIESVRDHKMSSQSPPDIHHSLGVITAARPYC